MFNEKRSSMLHGVLLIALFSCAAFYIGEMSFVRSISFSPMIVGIILGMLYANSLRNHLPETWVPGIQFCSKKILRIGIILYGFRLTFQDVMAIGLPAMLIDVIIVAVTICAGYPVLLEEDSAYRYHFIWLQIDFSGCDGYRVAGYADRCDYCGGDYLWRYLSW